MIFMPGPIIISLFGRVVWMDGYYELLCWMGCCCFSRCVDNVERLDYINSGGEENMMVWCVVLNCAGFRK